jgi:hypothetical protein
MMPSVWPFALKLTCPLCRSNTAVMHSFFSEIPHHVSRANTTYTFEYVCVCVHARGTHLHATTDCERTNGVEGVVLKRTPITQEPLVQDKPSRTPFKTPRRCVKRDAGCLLAVCRAQMSSTLQGRKRWQLIVAVSSCAR